VNSLLHREGDDDLDDLNGTKDREITLGTTMILGIFFALAVLCAVFFGFGYQLGRKSVVTAPPAASVEGQPGTNFAGFKPAAGSPAGSSSDKASGPTVAVPYAPAPIADSPAPRPTTQAVDDSNDGAANDTPAPAPVTAAPPSARPPNPPVSATSLASTPGPTGAGAIVQIAAVSHQEDADLLVTTLKRRGYNVAVHTEPQDKLLHVQIGPFPSHKDADAMRQRLLADGFNAIVKDTK
jgi:cell division septation protein DedD